MDYQIEIKGLKLYGYHGVFEEEKKLGQEFLLDIDLWLSSDLLAEDNINNCLSYADVTMRVKELFLAEKYDLLEKICLVLLEDLGKFKGVNKAKVALKKTAPPIPLPLESVGIIMEQVYSK